MIKAIIFDLDGVLIDSEKLNAIAFEQAINLLKIDLIDAKEYFYKNIAGKCNRQKFYSDFVNVNSRKFEKTYFDFLDKLYSCGIPQKAGVDELINFCLECKLKIAIASMTMNKERLMLKLKKANIDAKLFDLIVCTDSVVKPKPAPDIYLKVCGELNLSPMDTLVVEDSNVGSLAAITAGCNTVIIKDVAVLDEDTILHAASYINAGSLADVISIIKKFNSVNTDQLRRDFIKFEADHQLYDYKCCGELLWPYIRWIAFHYLNDHISNGTAHFKHHYGDLRKDFWLMDYHENYNLTADKYKSSEIFFINAPRRTFNGKYYSSDFDCIINALRQNYRLSIFEEPMYYWVDQIKYGHLMPCVNYDILVFLDQLENDAINLRDQYLNKNPDVYSKITKSVKSLLSLIESHFGIKYSDNYIRDFVMEWFYIKKNRKVIFNMLKKSKCKMLLMYYVPTHANLLFIEAANKLSVPTVELQHGIYSDYEPIFHQVYDRNRDYWHLPKHIILYGLRTINRQQLPQNIKLHVGGKLYLEQRSIELKNVKKNQKQILVVSQLDIKRPLCVFVEKLAKLLPDYTFIYKLHPLEEEDYYHNVFIGLNNVKLVKATEKDIYYYHVESALQIGVYSTGLLEGLYFHLPTFIIKTIEQSNRISNLVSNVHGVYFVQKPEDVVQIINQNGNIDVGNISGVWTKCSENSIMKIIDGILKQNQGEVY